MDQKKSNTIGFIWRCNLEPKQVLKQIRHNRRWTQTQLSDAIGSDSAYVAKLEQGKRNVGIKTATRLLQLDLSNDEQLEVSNFPCFKRPNQPELPQVSSSDEPNPICSLVAALESHGELIAKKFADHYYSTEFWTDLALAFSMSVQEIMVWSLKYDASGDVAMLDFIRLHKMLERWRRFTLRALEILDTYLYLPDEGILEDHLHRPALEHWSALVKVFNDVFAEHVQKYGLPLVDHPESLRNHCSEAPRGLDNLCSLQDYLEKRGAVS